MKRILRRRFELLVLAIAGALFWFGLHLPPPVGSTYVVVGAVENVEVLGDGSVVFSVNGRRLRTSKFDRRLRSQIASGAHALVVVWPYVGDDVILELSLDGRKILSSSSRLVFSWGGSVLFVSMGVLALQIVARALKSDETLLEQARRRQAMLKESKETPRRGK